MQHRYRTRMQGESLQSKIRELEWSFLGIVYFPVCFGIISVFAWLSVFGLFVLNLWTAIGFTLITVFICLRSYKQYKKNKSLLVNYRKGLEGERFVGEMLNKMSSDSVQVFHDIPGERFNVDHIIVSTRGVFVVETKHFDRDAGYEFYFDGNMVRRKMKNGKMILCPKLLPQMDGEARFIHDEIMRRTTLDVPVIKVAIIIGSFVHTPAETDGFKNIKRYFDKYWITNEKLFKMMFQEEPEIYDDSVVKLISTHINELVKIDIEENLE